MGAPSGTVILCDQVYQAQGGKFVLAGTYTTIEVHCRDAPVIEHQVPGLALYLRLRPERTGRHACEVLVRDELLPPWAEPVMRHAWELPIDERNLRLLEVAMNLPGFTVRVQPQPDQPVVQLRASIEFRVDGELVATTPLDLRLVRDLR